MDYSTFTLKGLKELAVSRGYPQHYHKASWSKAQWIEWHKTRDERDKEEEQKRLAEEQHRMSRDLRLFRQLEPNPSNLEYPFSYINNEYNGFSFEYIYKEVLGYPVDRDDVYGFPINIKEYYWVHAGENDEDNWYALGKLDSGLYFFYKGWCDYTGFDCQGGMDLYASEDWKGLLTMAMGSSDYDEYRKDCTIPVSDV